MEQAGSVVVSTSAWHAGFDPRSNQACHIMLNNVALNIRDCVSLCLSEEALEAAGPLYLVYIPGEVQYPTQGIKV